jgi:Fe-S oxidoreductase
MCPSYMATGDELHSTRGRARLLFEMLQGEAVTGGWRDEAIKQSLDLCLSCKACKSECPTNVDMAAYSNVDLAKLKVEFLAHYYEGRRRPLRAHAFGRVDRWLRAASRVPHVANALLAAPGAAPFLRRTLGIAPERALPRVATAPFRLARRVQETAGAATVVLWADTFNAFLHPAALHAAVAVLERTGAGVHVPPPGLCCGRPLYDFGLLDEARRYLVRVLDALAPAIDAGLPIVVLLFPRDARASRLRRQTLGLGEFLVRRAPAWEPPRLGGRVLLQGHCHQKALAGMADEESLLARTGAEVVSPDAGCCGMAGPFGFDAASYGVSQAIAERVLLPAVRREPEDTTIVADGFSCREQIRQGTGREPLHLAELLARALVAAEGHSPAGTGRVKAER